MSEASVKMLSDLAVFNKYAKFVPKKERRENWEEMCQRNMDMLIARYPGLEKEIRKAFRDFVLTKKVLPSMRSMQFAGRPIELSHNRIYNCCYMPADNPAVFHEAMFLLLGGTGVGYSVQSQHIDKLPPVAGPRGSSKFVVQDSVIGWSDAVKALVKAFFKGSSLPLFDFSDIRPKGSPLRTSGGKAPGPEPLRECLSKVESVFRAKKPGEKLSSLEVHDILCHIADAVLSGGIRRAAMICLFDVDDELMLGCKGEIKCKLLEVERETESGAMVKVEKNEGGTETVALDREELEKLRREGVVTWYHLEGQRGRANNSAVFVRHKVRKRDFERFWGLVIKNRSGEPGIYFTNNADWGTNPCAEIGLRPNQFCNLCEVNANGVSSQQELERRVAAAAFLGTLQAGFTDFHYLRGVWKKTTEREALIGVSFTGLAGIDHKSFDFRAAAAAVKRVNAETAKAIGIRPSSRSTCVKPAGTTSLVLGCSSGIHAWFDRYYIRRMTVNKEESIYPYLKRTIPELLEDSIFNPQRDAMVNIPMAAPEGAIVAPEESALEFLARVKYFSDNWVKPGHTKGDNTHNVSATVYVKDDEWEGVGEWMWQNRDTFNGLSVLPFDGGTYKQAPHESISKEVYEKMRKSMKKVELSSVSEKEDKTQRSDQIACSGGACDVTF